MIGVKYNENKISCFIIVHTELYHLPFTNKIIIPQNKYAPLQNQSSETALFTVLKAKFYPTTFYGNVMINLIQT